MEDNDDDYDICNICYDHVIELIFIPCGHSICEKCYNNLGITDC